MVQEVGEIFSIKVNIIYGQKRDGKNCDCWGRHKKLFFFLLSVRVAGLGRLSAGAKMAMRPFIKRIFTIFATNASFLRVFANLQV